MESVWEQMITRWTAQKHDVQFWSGEKVPRKTVLAENTLKGLTIRKINEDKHPIAFQDQPLLWWELG